MYGRDYHDWKQRDIADTKARTVLACLPEDVREGVERVIEAKRNLARQMAGLPYGGGIMGPYLSQMNANPRYPSMMDQALSLGSIFGR